MISEALRLLRVYHDLSQTELAGQLHISNSYISELEKGAKVPTLQILEKYSKYFEIPLSSLIFFSEQLDSRSSTDALRKGIAKKVISLLNWVIDNHDRPRTEKKRAA